MYKETLLSEALGRNASQIGYFIGERLKKLCPEQYILETTSPQFHIPELVRKGGCVVTHNAATYHQIETGWHDPNAPLPAWNQNAWLDVQWRGHQLQVVHLSYRDDYCNANRYWIIAESQEAAEGFLRAVCECNFVVQQAIMVFDNGYWAKSEELYRSIKAASFDNLILPAQLKEEFRGDLTRFFASREMYEELGVPWKRGLLLTGPPGNGKTHAVKALLNHLDVTCLYVKTFTNRYSDENAIKTVFDQARLMAPCILVLEDLDSMIDNETRSFFLNELDGFEKNNGIAVLATTNYPERLDPAIINRPSRFDRKYHFKLPAEQERLAYLTLWGRSAKAQLRLSETGAREIAHLTDGFSFAYLKELVLSSLMQWMNGALGQTMDGIMKSQVAMLREQMGAVQAAATAAA